MTNMPLPPRRSTGTAPLRVPGSVRRTSSIDVTWPEGSAGRMRFVGRARDLVTPRSGEAPTVVAEDSFEALVRRDRAIDTISAEPPRASLAQLVGERGGGGLRKVLGEAFPDERSNATPLYLVLDDIAGVTLISSVAWLQWDPDWIRKAFGDAPMETLLKSRERVCTAHAPGSSAQDPKRARRDYGEAIAADLQRSGDPEGWHLLEVQDGVGLRRARRIDVSVGEAIVIDAEFQDSTSRPGGGRSAVHEYGLSMTADPVSLKVLSIAAEPRVLPYPECPSATANLPRLLGVRLPDLRERVLVDLAGTAGCTHLNDALRALADVPALLRHIG